MFVDSLIFFALSLLLSCVTLFTLGHRLRHTHWLASIAAIGLLGAAAWWLQSLLLGSAPPFDAALAASLVSGALVTAAFKDWNAWGHACFSASLSASVIYLAYTGYVLVAAHLGPWSLVFGILLLALQAAALTLLAVHTFEIIDVLCRTRWQFAVDALHVAGFAPKVSIHVPIHREPPEMVMQTLDALARLNYDNYEVLVIDNNTSEEDLWRPIEAHCAKLGDRFRFFHLLPWPGYKSGALNFALGETACDAEIIGIVDSDYLAEPDWLANLVGHFSDPEMAFVQTPQDYRDGATRGHYGKALALSYIYFFRISMASRNERNAIIFAGTMGLLRKSALVEVGGWDEWCITEDAEVSLRLLNAGYRSLYVDRTYGRGLMPLDYAGLKKQRFRWAFGGMQVLRLHARKLLNPWAGKLTVAQRWAYLSGGMQWLNDPMTLAFTAVLLVGGMALLLESSFAVLPLLGAALFVPPLFVLFAVSRFLWALRVREGDRCTFPEATRALAILLGMTWVVSLACLRGLVSREGVFLRTPKQADVPALRDSLRISVWETGFGVVCLGLAVALVSAPDFELASARTLVVALLAWQGLIYACTLLSTLWDYGQRRAQNASPLESWHMGGYLIGRSLTEPKTATWVVAGVCGLALSWYVAREQAPQIERLFRSDPLNQFVHAPSVMKSTQSELAGAVLVVEADAATRGDLQSALAQWAADGVVVDENHTPDDPGDDRTWRGIVQVRERYVEEFKSRRYRSLRHLAPRLTIDGDTAVIVNDLYADVENVGAGGRSRVRLARSDRWVLRYRHGKWTIASLHVNRATRRPSIITPGE